MEGTRAACSPLAVEMHNHFFVLHLILLHLVVIILHTARKHDQDSASSTQAGGYRRFNCCTRNEGAARESIKTFVSDVTMLTGRREHTAGEPDIIIAELGFAARETTHTHLERPLLVQWRRRHDRIRPFEIKHSLFASSSPPRTAALGNAGLALRNSPWALSQKSKKEVRLLFRYLFWILNWALIPKSGRVGHATGRVCFSVQPNPSL
jgi:hypothetical protein